jgi:hypothetical protein
MGGEAWIRVDGANRVLVTASGEELPLPTLADLKREALEWVRGRADEVSIRAAELLSACDLDYETVTDETGIRNKLGVIAFTDDESAWMLSDEDGLETWYVVSGLHEACPNLERFRAVVRE